MVAVDEDDYGDVEYCLLKAQGDLRQREVVRVRFDGS